MNECLLKSKFVKNHSVQCYYPPVDYDSLLNLYNLNYLIKKFLSVSRGAYLYSLIIINCCLAPCCVCQTSTSVESRAPAVSRTAPTTPGVMNATAQQDIDSTQTGVAVTVCLPVILKVDGMLSISVESREVPV